MAEDQAEKEAWQAFPGERLDEAIERLGLTAQYEADAKAGMAAYLAALAAAASEPKRGVAVIGEVRLQVAHNYITGEPLACVSVFDDAPSSAIILKSDEFVRIEVHTYDGAARGHKILFALQRAVQPFIEGLG